MQNLIHKIEENLHLEKKERKNSELSTDSQENKCTIFIFLKI